MSVLTKIAKHFVPEKKQSATHQLIAMQHPCGPIWTNRSYATLARNGVTRNVIVNRCVRLIAEAASAVPLAIGEAGARCEAHPVLDVLQRPNDSQTGTSLLETIYGHLQTSGNAYVEAVRLDGEVRELYALRPDRVKVRPDTGGWPAAFEYSVGGRKAVFRREADGFMPVLHIRLFHPLDDFYGLSPLEAAADAVDIHNAASAWNKQLLDNAARPSGALVYKGPEGAPNLTADQFDRLKADLQEGWQGQRNAGRPFVLDGGMDWKPMSLSPTDMDFINAKNGAARDIALAFGVPPQLLGIPGDNTYSNYREANLAFWRQTVLPLVGKVTQALSGWLCPEGSALELGYDAARVDTFSPDRDARLAQIMAADFLTDREKREAFGFAPIPDEDVRRADNV